MILGHECCAEAVEVGELVKDFKPGDQQNLFRRDHTGLEIRRRHRQDTQCIPADSGQDGSSNF